MNNFYILSTATHRLTACMRLRLAPYLRKPPLIFAGCTASRYYTASKHRIHANVTNDLSRRVYEHKEKITKSFTAQYSVNKLVYFEEYDNINDAIAREKQIKAGSRQKRLI